MAAQFGSDLVDHHTYVLVGDGCLMEGISEEAIELAGHLKLSKLVVLHDDNHITIDGSTALSVSTDQVARFEASNWNATRIDGHDPDAILAALGACEDQRQAVLHLLPHHHRLRRADQGRHQCGAWRPARRRRDRRRPQGARLGISALRDPVRRAGRLAPRRPARAPGPQGAGTSAWARPTSSAAPSSKAPHPRRPALEVRRDHLRGDRQGAGRWRRGGDLANPPRSCWRPSPPRCRKWSAARPT